MKPHFTVLALAALITIGSALPGFAEDAAPPKEIMAQPPAGKEPPPVPPSVPRPSLAPKAAEPAPVAEPASRPVTEPAQRPHRRYAHRRRGYYHTAYWEPFPIFWPHYYHHRVHWNRVPWFFRF